MGALAIAVLAAGALAIAVLAAGCGLAVRSPDLFVLTRTGAGQRLTLLVNDSGTVSCNGRASQPLPDPLLLQARDLASSLDSDAKSRLRLPPVTHSVNQYTVRLQDGTISFPDTAGATHHDLAQAELFAVQVAEGPCRRST
jgi:hypothetical protein